MRLKVIACGVLEPELEALAQQSPHEIELHTLDAGLHSAPAKLRLETQAVIDESRDVEAIILGYGLCGRGVSGLIARHCRVVLPKAHDCLTLFLGSRAAYGKQFKEHPGTYYITPGWYEKSLAPKQAKRAVVARDLENAEKSPRFSPLAEKYGEENARYILWFQDSWKRNYTRVAFLDTGVGDVEKYTRYARDMAEALGWQFERIEADLHLLHAALLGEWERQDLLVVEPGQRVVATGDDTIIAAIDRDEQAEPALDSDETMDTESSRPEVQEPAGDPAVRRPSEAAGPMTRLEPAARPVSADEPLAIGIDAGGTYTDCVLCTLDDAIVLSKAKAPTTPHDLAVGIREGLAKLDWPEPTRIRSVSLSTTLATNAIAENKGGTPGLLLMPSVSQAKIDWALTRTVPGQMTISGAELEPTDADATLIAVDDLLAAGADAFAVVGYSSVRNPAHELAVAELVRSRCDLPVVCGHELSQQLNLINRANTAILNARLFPPIRELLDAAKAMLRDFGVEAPLWVVKGDGSLMNEETALTRPIDTLLSGPAASVAGARHLSGATEALVIDMGGTTTDSALLEGGVVRLKEDGIRVNGWPLNVVAADIATVGLGGDSRVDFTSNRTLTVGPDRALPLCFIGAQFPRVTAELASLDPSTILDRGSARALEYLCLRRVPPAEVLRGQDAAVVAVLRDGPLTRPALARRLGLVSAHLLFTDALESRGYLIRSAFTPTDVLHARGELTLWEADASRHALRLFADLYGASPTDVAAAVIAAVVRKLCEQVIRRETGIDTSVPECAQLLDHALSQGNGSRLSFQPHYRRPLVAIGAPVHAYFPTVADILNGELVLPPHAEVANAVGAAASEVLVREVVTVRPGDTGAYLLHSRAGRREFTSLAAALRAAEEAACSLAEQRARTSGAETCRLRAETRNREGFAADGSRIFIEATVEATASGKGTRATSPTDRGEETCATC